MPDRTAHLRIGEPGRTVSGQQGAGGVVDYALDHGRHQARGSGQITLATKGVPGSPRAGDAMGAALYSYYETGIPTERSMAPRAPAPYWSTSTTTSVGMSC